MAHYAKDCWDAEVETSYDWIEVAGHADRSCFDLTRHAEKTKVELVAARPLKEPQTIKYVHVTLEKPKIGKTFKKDSKPICEFLDSLDDEKKEKYMADMTANGEIKIALPDGKEITLSSEFVKFEQLEKTI